MENITNLLPSRPIVIKKEPRHISCYHNQIQRDFEVTKGSHATMGLAEEGYKDPTNYLKGRERQKIDDKIRQINTEIRAEIGHAECQAKPSIPKGLSMTQFKSLSKAKDNFIAFNVNKIKESSPPVIPLKHFYNTKGDEEDLIKSGKWPHYIFKKSFGQPPSYLERMKRCEAARTVSNQNDRTSEPRNECSDLTKDEIDELIKGLRSNLQSRHRKLQRLPVVCETGEQKEMKRDLEKQIEEIERNVFILTTFNVTVTN